MLVHSGEALHIRHPIYHSGGHMSYLVCVCVCVQDKCSLSQLPLTDGDKLAVEKEVRKG